MQHGSLRHGLCSRRNATASLRPPHCLPKSSALLPQVLMSQQSRAPAGSAGSSVAQLLLRLQRRRHRRSAASFQSRTVASAAIVGVHLCEFACPNIACVCSAPWPSCTRRLATQQHALARLSRAPFAKPRVFALSYAVGTSVDGSCPPLSRRSRNGQPMRPRVSGDPTRPLRRSRLCPQLSAACT